MSSAGSAINSGHFAGQIDHTLLKPDAERALAARYCDEAMEYGFASVCVNPWFVPLVAKCLSGSAVHTCAVVGFPLGATLPAAKLAETRAVLDAGADEVDMVLCVSALIGGEFSAVHDDIAAIKNACGQRTLKVILETCLLTREQKIRACEISREAGADFVKTSTGFGAAGATEADVRLMRQTVGDALGVKASGGIRTYGDAVAMLNAGASRIGASSGIALLSGEDSCSVTQD